MKFLVKKTPTGLIPVYNSDAESLKEAKLKMGEVYEIDIKKKRNYNFHKKLFALYNLCYDNQDVFDNLDEVRYYLTMKAGYYKKIETPKGEMFVPKSISFAKMDNIEFEKLYQRTIDEVCNLLQIDDKTELLNQILEFM